MCVGRVPNSETEAEKYPTMLKVDNSIQVPTVIEKVFPQKIGNPLKEDAVLSQDALAVMTIWTKEALFTLSDYVKSLSDTTAYR